MKRLLLAALALLPVAAFAGTLPFLHVGLAGTPTSNASTPIFSSVQLPASGAAAQFGAVQCTTTTATCFGTSATQRRIPLPFAGTIDASTVVAHLGTSPTAALTMTDNINGVDGTVVCTFAIGVQTGACTGGPDAVTANSAFQWHFVTTGWNQASPSQISFVYKATGGQHVAILLQPNNFGAGATTTFYGFPGSVTNATETNISSIVCQGCAGTINGINVLPNITENGSNAHTITLVHNGTVLTGTVFCTTTLSSAAACSMAGLPISIAAGDSFSLQVTCSTTCNSITMGVGIDFTPNTQGVVPLFANQISQGVGFMGVNDFTELAGQTNFQTVPAAMTFSNYQICGLGTTTGTQTRTAIMQSGSTGAAPTTSQLTATITSGTGACPGSQSATYLSGATVGGSYSAAAGSTIDNSYTITNAPALTPIKISAAVVVSASGGSSAPILIDLPMSAPGPAFLP